MTQSVNQLTDDEAPDASADCSLQKIRDQAERRTTLAQFRGKMVALAFVNSHCMTICPLMTESLVEAVRLLGPAASQVQPLGINANPLATNVAVVAAYTRTHQTQGRRRFLTGSLPELERDWRDYHVYVTAVHNDLDRQPIVILIDERGREHSIYFTQGRLSDGYGVQDLPWFALTSPSCRIL